jgi:hypothetical protein
VVVICVCVYFLCAIIHVVIIINSSPSLGIASIADDTGSITQSFGVPCMKTHLM